MKRKLRVSGAIPQGVRLLADIAGVVFSLEGGHRLNWAPDINVAVQQSFRSNQSDPVAYSVNR
jgi:hypothetical protein